MDLTSMRLRTDLLFWRFGGEVADRGDHLVVRTPSNPSYYFGNLLVFGAPPREGDVGRWREAFAQEFSDDARVRHETFEWDVVDGDTGATDGFVREGFDLVWNVTLLAERVTPPPSPNRDVDVRPIISEAEWDAVLENHVACREDGHEAEAYRTFSRKQLGEWRRMAAAGLGGWFGAFVDGRLVGDLGLFHDGDVGRFQNVGTHPEFRQRGVCGTLVFEVSRRAFDDGLRTLVMVADESYHAARVYESVGFVPSERSASLCLRPRD